MPESAAEVLDRPADELAEVPEETAPDAAEVIAADLLVEEISIDGMCGVY